MTRTLAELDEDLQKAELHIRVLEKKMELTKQSLIVITNYFREKSLKLGPIGDLIEGS